ncbi:hypothetical protein KY334_04675 [Candidatus Woesearchaeota archaeon]|nr:hypothetical protein [Candidatus Woesearchaeota archaeon]
MQEKDLISRIFEEAVPNDLVKRVIGFEGPIVENPKGTYSIELKEINNYTHIIFTNLRDESDTFRYFQVYDGYFEGPLMEEYKTHKLSHLIETIHKYLLENTKEMGKKNKRRLYCSNKINF